MDNDAKIFLSHNSKDKQFVLKLAKSLKDEGLTPWYDEWELKVGDSLHSKISEGISESGWLAVILSKNSVKSDWVTHELNAALAIELKAKEVFVLPILIEDCELPIFLADKVFADFRTNFEKGMRDLLKTINPQTLIQERIFSSLKHIKTNTKYLWKEIINIKAATKIQCEIKKSTYQKIEAELAYLSIDCGLFDVALRHAYENEGGENILYIDLINISDELYELVNKWSNSP